MFEPNIYYSILAGMTILACVVFFALQRITPGYGMMYSSKWGPSLGNRLGWILMEAPAFFGMLIIWLSSERATQPALVVMTLLFLLHYFQRSFIFPMLIKGKNRMPLLIILCGMTFNTLNAYMIGGWLFHISPERAYPLSWLCSPLFILGVIVFFAGMGINLHSDNIIRHLRRPGDSRHYIPRGGLYLYVTSANYFGELTEWAGYALLTWSLPGLVFLIWTFANLAPRSKAIHARYLREFGDDYAALKRRFIIPFIY